MSRAKKVRQILVKWKGFLEPAWEDQAHLEDVEAMDHFENLDGKRNSVGENEGARQGR